MTSFRRTSFGLKLVVRPDIEAAFSSSLIDRIRARDDTLPLGPLQIRLPRKFGLCHGVERAIQLAHETRHRFPQERLFLTDEIVHNQSVNDRLRELGFRYLSGRYSDGTLVSDLGPGDLVVLPAFGVEVEMLEQLQRRGVQMVDTTCGEVMNVWKRVRQYAQVGFTTVMHGAPGHQETLATVSRAVRDDPFLTPSIDKPGAWVVLRNEEQADLLARHIEGQVTAAEIEARFAHACSPGFDAERDLQRVGIANQTTMLAGETLRIQQRLQHAFVARYGAADAAQRLLTAETICTATQDRQDALRTLLDEPLDLLLVIGGYNSANTSHLVEMARARGLPAYHIDRAECVLSEQRLRHWHAQAQAETETDTWLTLPARVGIAAGASTPDARIDALVRRLGDVVGHPLPTEPMPSSTATG